MDPTGARVPPHTPARTWLVLGVAVAGLAAAAAYEAVTSDRWGAPADLRAAAARLDRVPAAFGDWTGTDAPQEDKVLRAAEAVGHVSRVYRHGKTGAEVTVLLLCGPAGPIGAHAPEYCYAGNGYEPRGTPVAVAVADKSDPARVFTYWSARFEKKPPSPGVPLRVCYAWGTDGDWTAATNPRARFALRGALYKLYAVRAEPDPPAADPTADPVHQFLTAFLPEVKKALVPPAAP